jgi:hypothetical protein
MARHATPPPNDFDVAMAAARRATQNGPEPPPPPPPLQGVGDTTDLRPAAAEGLGDLVKPEDLPVAVPDMPLKGIHAKLAWIMDTLPTGLEPSGWNRNQKYGFWEAGQITGLFRARFGALGISFLPDVLSFDVREHATKSEGRSYLTTIMVRFTLTDTETGETVSGTGIGQGDDPGDKGSNKALTGAVKNWLMKLSLVGGEDAEADERTDERAQAPSRGTQRVSRDVVIEDSHIEGIQRGGRANKATDVQIRQVRELARDLHLGPGGVADLMLEVLETGVALPAENEDQGPALLNALETLSAESIGKLIAWMAEIKRNEEQVPMDDAVPYG